MAFYELGMKGGLRMVWMVQIMRLRYVSSTVVRGGKVYVDGSFNAVQYSREEVYEQVVRVLDFVPREGMQNVVDCVTKVRKGGDEIRVADETSRK